jgi:hypothetical protein
VFLVRETGFQVLLWDNLNLVDLWSRRASQVVKGTRLELLVLEISSILLFHYDASDLRGASLERSQLVPQLVKLIELRNISLEAAAVESFLEHVLLSWDDVEAEALEASK